MAKIKTYRFHVYVREIYEFHVESTSKRAAQEKLDYLLDHEKLDFRDHLVDTDGGKTIYKGIAK